MNEDIVYIPQPESLRYYVYYNKDTGRIDGISCGLLTLKGFETYLEISSTLYEKLDKSAGKLEKYVVALDPNSSMQQNGSTFIETDKIISPEVVDKITKETAFKGNVFKLILDEVTSSTDLIVEWNLPLKQWTFSVNESSKLRLLNENYKSSNLVFFVILENDFDFLIRTIYIKAGAIALSTVHIPFESAFEFNINKIAIAARTIFDKHGLKKVYETN